jgi:hypothetical protein
MYLYVWSHLVEFDREARHKPEVGVQIDETTATYRRVVIMASPRISLVNFVTIIKSHSVNCLNLFKVRGYWWGNYWGCIVDHGWSWCLGGLAVPLILYCILFCSLSILKHFVYDCFQCTLNQKLKKKCY